MHLRATCTRAFRPRANHQRDSIVSSRSRRPLVGRSRICQRNSILTGIIKWFESSRTARSERETRSIPFYSRLSRVIDVVPDRRRVRQDVTSFQFYVISWRHRGPRPDLIEVPSIKRATGTPVFPGGCLYFVRPRRKYGLSNLSSVESRSTSGHCKVSVMSLPFYILERWNHRISFRTFRGNCKKRLHVKSSVSFTFYLCMHL